MVKKKRPLILVQDTNASPLTDPSGINWLGKPIWVRGQVRVSVAHVERMRKAERGPWLVKGDHLPSADAFLLSLLGNKQ
jgi:hypothetical protein